MHVCVAHLMDQLSTAGFLPQRLAGVDVGRCLSQAQPDGTLIDKRFSLWELKWSNPHAATDNELNVTARLKDLLKSVSSAFVSIDRS